MNDQRPIVVFCRAAPGEIEMPGCEVRTGPPERLVCRALYEHISGADAVVTWVSERVDDAFLDAVGPQLKVVANLAVGYDNVDIEACKARGVFVTNTPDAVTEGTANMAWALLLAVARRLVQADAFARSQEYPKEGPLGPDKWLGMDLTGRTLLIVGGGRIGFATAMRSIGWGMKVLYVARSKKWNFELAPLAAERVSLEDGLARADVVSVHVPLNNDTHHMIDADAISRMKTNAILINTARGPIVDEDALVEALNAERIWGAGLDVYEKEPLVHPGLIASDRVALAPHIGSAERRYRSQMTAMACANVRAVLGGTEPPNRVV